MEGQISTPPPTEDHDINPDLALPLQLVHRILLTDAGHFDTLRSTTTIPNLTFQQFRALVLHNDDANGVIKRAFHDNIKESIEIKQSWLPLYNLLLELHTSIRLLVPNRRDLHSTLQDPLPPEAGHVKHFKWEAKILHAAKSLAQLESPLRSETTCQWITSVEDTQKDDNGHDHTSNHSHDWSFWILSLLYLLDKSEICSQEKRDFYLTQVVAPRLHITGEGFLIERREFMNKFSWKPPITQQWIKTLVESLRQEDKEPLRQSCKERHLLVTTGWIQSILFQSEHPTQLPEIFSLDLETLHSIRKVTRTAAAGSSLGWHALQALNRDNNNNNNNTLLQDERQGASIVQTMNNIHRYSTIEAYEEAVADSLISLTQNWNNGLPLQPQLIETLRGHTQAVLRGEDPVLRLLDDRMKKLFVALAKYSIHGLSGAPLSMETGQTIMVQQNPTMTGYTGEASFIRFARQEICKAGLAFYSHDLAQTAQAALKVPDLAYHLYADQFLDQMVLDEL